MVLITVACNASVTGAAGVCVPLHECTAHVTHRVQLVSMCHLHDNSVGVICQSRRDRIRLIHNRWITVNGGKNSSAINGQDFKKRNNNDKGQKKGDHETASINGDNLHERLLSKRPVRNRLKPSSYMVYEEKVEEAMKEASQRLKLSESQISLATHQRRFPNVFHNQTVMQNMFFANKIDDVDSEAREVRFDIELLSVLNEHGGVRINNKRFRRSTGGQRTIPNCLPSKQPVCLLATASEFWRNDNGQCNNLRKTKLGSAMTAQARLLKCRYQDGIWHPITLDSSGGQLASPRLISTTLINTIPNEDQHHTTLLVMFGQLIGHDVVSTGTIRPGDLESCCSDLNFPEVKLHKDCFPIRIPWDDYLYRRIGMRCMNQFRSRPAEFDDCVLRPVSPANQVTHYLDGSTIYGSDSQRAAKLRQWKNGKIRMDELGFLVTKDGRFLSGESRSNIIPLLTLLHTIWTREHNRVAEELSRIEPKWNDQQLYLMARRIVVAELQHIVYNEYLPIIIGQQYMDEHAISTDVDHKLGYSDTVDPSVSVEFSTAAFRFGHSQVPDVLKLKSEIGKFEEDLFTASVFFQEELIKKKDMMEHLAHCLVNQKPRKVGSSYSSALHERLFASGIDKTGLDLVGLNINRGRDHGLPSFIQMLQACTGQAAITSWIQLLHYFNPIDLFHLMKVYKDIEDIELYVGGTLEKKVPGALVGSVFQCIIGEQFFSLMYGDRFFYAHKNMSTSLNERQLAEIQHGNWARILCDNVPSMRRIQPLALWQPHPTFNPRQSCDSSAIPRVNLTVFKH